MELLRLQDVPTRPEMKVFRNSVLHQLAGLVTTLAVLGAFVAVYVKGELPLWVLIAVGLFVGLGAWLALRSTARSLSSANWVMTTDAGGVWVKLTHFLKNHLYTDEAQAVFIPFSEVKEVRVVRPVRKDKGPRRTRSVFFTFLELDLEPDRPSDLEDLSAALETVRKVKTGGMMVPLPVFLSDNILKIKWRGRNVLVTPRVERAVEELARHVSVGDP